MPEGKGYKAGYSSTPSVKPNHGNYGGHFDSTPSSDKQGGYGAPPGARKSAPFPRNPKQKDAKGGTGGYRNLTRSGDPGNKGY